MAKKNKQKKNMAGAMAGKGDYTTAIKSLVPELKKAAKSAILAAGSTLGASVAGPAGSAVGTALARRLSRFIGTGDYASQVDCEHNSLVLSSKIPKSLNVDPHSIRLTHREYIGDIISKGTGFNTYTFRVNPGICSTFPYLYNMAQLFEQYRFDGLIFEFVSSTSNYIASGGNVGTVIMAAEYNAYTPTYTTKTIMENSDFAISARTDVNMVYGVECKSQASEAYYVSNGNSLSSKPTPPKTQTDLCNLVFATQGCPTASGTSIGELWCVYDVVLMKPIIPQICTSASFSCLASSPYQALPGYAPQNRSLGTATINYSNNASFTLGIGTPTFCAVSNCCNGDIFKVEWVWYCYTPSSNPASSVPTIVLSIGNSNGLINADSTLYQPYAYTGGTYWSPSPETGRQTVTNSQNQVGVLISDRTAGLNVEYAVTHTVYITVTGASGDPNGQWGFNFPTVGYQYVSTDQTVVTGVQCTVTRVSTGFVHP